MLNPKTGKRWKVYMGLPSNGSVSDFQNYVLRDLADRYKDEVELVFPELLCQRIFHDAAREGVIQDFLDTDCDILWFLDSDICPPQHTLDLITSHGDKWELAGCPYPVFMAHPGEAHRQIIYTVYREIAPDPETKKPRVAPIPSIPSEGTDFVAGIATGCLMVKREVFSKISRPYFEFKYDPITRQPIEGEDIGFIIKMCRLSKPFFIDYSMVCKHYKNNIDLLEMNNYAMSFAQKAVDRQSVEISNTIKLVEEKYNKLKAQNKELKSALQQLMDGAARNQRSGPVKPVIFR